MGAEVSSTGNEEANAEQERRRNITLMDGIVRNKVRNGVQYNMKIILRGVRKTGKTSLFRRFQGFPFSVDEVGIWIVLFYSFIVSNSLKYDLHSPFFFRLIAPLPRFRYFGVLDENCVLIIDY
jgi:hypothetical protein